MAEKSVLIRPQGLYPGACLQGLLPGARASKVCSPGRVPSLAIGFQCCLV